MEKREACKDCFGYKKSDYCSVLSEMVCAERECSFYKNKKEYIDDMEKYGWSGAKPVEVLRQARLKRETIIGEQ